MNQHRQRFRHHNADDSWLDAPQMPPETAVEDDRGLYEMRWLIVAMVGAIWTSMFFMAAGIGTCLWLVVRALVA